MLSHIHSIFYFRGEIMDNFYLKIIRNGDKYAALNLKTLGLFKVSEYEAKILESFYNHDRDFDYVSSLLHIEKKKCRDLINVFETPLGPIENLKLEPAELLLMISQDCNLRCKYCYATGGSYGEKRRFMDTKTAEKAIDVAFSLGNIKSIVFFGGEPLLNFELIKHLVNYTKKRDIVYGFVTNGTLLTDEMIKFFKKNNFYITISLDGPKEVNDANRIYPDSRGTYDVIIKTIEKLKENKIKFSLEATFTKTALKKGYRARDILEFLYRYTDSIKITPVGFIDDPSLTLSKEDLIEYFDDCYSFALDKIRNDKPINIFDITMLIYRIVSWKKHTCDVLCPSIAKRLTVFPDGNVYPCYLIKEEDYCYGNIFNDNFKEVFSEKAKDISRKLSRKNLKQKEWYIPLLTDICFGYIKKENDKLEIEETMKEVLSEVLERFIKELITIDDWNKVIKNISGG